VEKLWFTASAEKLKNNFTKQWPSSTCTHITSTTKHPPKYNLFILTRPNEKIM
jgi:hypothetical protein